MGNIPEMLELAVQYHQAQQWQQSAELCRQIVTADAQHAQAWHLLGLTRYYEGNREQSLVCLRRAVASDPQNAWFENSLGNVLAQSGELDEAISCYRRAIQLLPDYAQAHNNLGNVLADKGFPELAVDSFRQAIRFQPDYALAYNGIGTAYLELGNPIEAEGFLHEALRLDPQLFEAYCNLGKAFMDRGEVDPSLDSYQRALDLAPEYAEAHIGRGIALLAKGDYARGWPEYEWRWKISPLKDSLRSFSQPLWAGESLEDQTILTWGEQGIGDEIMFASCFSELQTRASQCLIACESRLTPLFSRSFPAAQVIDSSVLSDPIQLAQLGPIQFQVPAGTLPCYLRLNEASFPDHRGYLVSSRDRVEYWRKALEELGSGLKIGISWRGGKNPAVKSRRSISLDQWHSVFDNLDVKLVNVQYGNCQDELAAAQTQQGFAISHFSQIDPLRNMDEFAALISALDLVISVDNSTVHLAGALGVPVWVVLPFAAEWRWMLHRTDTPWYPTMRLFRQPVPNDWESVFRVLRTALRESLEQR